MDLVGLQWMVSGKAIILGKKNESRNFIYLDMADIGHCREVRYDGDNHVPDTKISNSISPRKILLSSFSYPV